METHDRNQTGKTGPFFTNGPQGIRALICLLPLVRGTCFQGLQDALGCVLGSNLKEHWSLY